jgi:GTPase SAR1 family protein
MIEEIPLNFKFDPKNSKLNYPQCRCGKCPFFYWNLLAVGSRGSGKTYNIVKLIKHYEENDLMDNDGNIHPLRTIVISPTLDANLIFNNLKSLDKNDKHDKFSDELLQSIVDEIKKDKEETNEYQKYIQAYKQAIKIKESKLNDFFKEHPDIYDILEKYSFEDPDEIPKPKYEISPVVIIVLDDLMATGAFTNKKLSSLTNNLIKNRHNGISFAILAQSVKSIPKNIRLNCNLFFISKFASKKVVLDDMFEEVSNVLTPEQFEELYDTATNEQYGSLIIDNTHKEKRFLRGLDSELIIK